MLNDTLNFDQRWSYSALYVSLITLREIAVVTLKYMQVLTTNEMT